MRVRFIALVAATVLFVAGWFFLGFKPAGTKLEEVKDQVEAKQAEVAALEARLARLQELKRNEKQLKEEAARLDKGLPKKPALPTFIRQVQAAANDAGINWLSIAPSTPSAAAGTAAPAPSATGSGAAPTQVGTLRAINITLSAKGSFFDLERFVSNLERLDRAMRIDTFGLSGAGELSLATTGKVFMSHVPTATAPAPAPAGG
jgi:Tfp pilus assembly protein PilO